MKFVVRGFMGEVTISCIFSTKENALRAALEYLKECDTVSINRLRDVEL